MSPALNRRQFDRVTLAFVACLAAHALWLPPVLTAAVALVVGLRRWLITVHLKAWPTWIRLPLLIALLLIVRDQFGGLGRNGGTALLIGLLALKLAESERRRDGLLVVCITLFLISIRFLFGESMLLTLYMVVPTLLCFLALTELHSQGGGALIERDQLGRLAWSALKTVAMALPLAILLWLLVPRLAQPLWGKPEVADDARTGLGDEMSPGKMTELLIDDNIAMRVRFETDIPAPDQLYWRGPVLWRFDGETWSGLSSWLRNNRLQEAARPPTSINQRYEVMLEPTDRPWLILLDVPVRTSETHHLTLDLQVIRPSTISSLLRYEGESMIGIPTPASAYPGTEREWALQLPRGYNPRARQLAASWPDEAAGDATAIAERAMSHFRTQPFAYSLSAPELGRDSVDDFLFETQTGYCEHYSSAFTFLMRAAGVPARVVTGYYGGYVNPIDQHVIVRNSDAHAWAEYHVNGVGWLRIDPTAAVAPERVDRSGLDLGLDGGWNNADWGQRLLMTLDAVGTWWNRTLLAFDARAQLAMLERLGLDGRWEQRALLLIGSFLGFALIAALIMWAPWRRQRVDPLLRLQARFESLITPWVGERPAGLGAHSYAARARAALPECGEAIDRYAHQFAARRYDPEAKDGSQLEDLEAALTELRLKLAGRAKPPRHLGIP
jgi:transglutaminase-like putative cysteine protease